MTQSQDLAPLLDKITAAAQPSATFSQPIEANGYTVITASEAMSTGGFGTGNDQTGNAGGGGGGFAMSRPVATIVIGPEGVKIRPVIDVTKLAIAGITAWGAMAIALARMTRKQ
ncbi:MAG TPA: hypothetical protein VFG86_12515 [Chloroflexota bacterium]|jgi:uncharacterized spore protein YtfJ|nr:hypothetical protein [Chloroflexota bacterium]